MEPEVTSPALPAPAPRPFLRRFHLAEIEDQPWCPALLRDALTDFLHAVLNLGGVYLVIVPRLRAALERCGTRRVIDLCSGGGGPWTRLLPALEKDGTSSPVGTPSPAGTSAVEVCLTDRFPNHGAFERRQSRSDQRITYHPHPVDAAKVPAELTGFRTLFTAFHHFPPQTARAVLADASRHGQGVALFEVTQRSFLSLVLIGIVVPISALLVTPFIRPFRWSRLFLTYVVPLVPLLACYDGLVSCLRTYSPAELLAFARELDGAGYEWEAGEARYWHGLSPIPITYLIGLPPATDAKPRTH